MASLSKIKPKVAASFDRFYYHQKAKKYGFGILLTTIETDLFIVRKRKDRYVTDI